MEGQEFEITDRHVVIPLSYFERLVEIYTLHKHKLVLEAEEERRKRMMMPSEEGTESIPSPPLRLSNVQVGPGYEPRGAAMGNQKEDEEVSPDGT